MLVLSWFLWTVQALTYDELLRFLAACRAASERDWLMAALSVNHGLRVTEIVGGWVLVKTGQKVAGKEVKKKVWHSGITPDAIKDGMLVVQRVKGSKRTEQPLVVHPNPLLDERAALERLVLLTPQNQPLFKMHRTTAWRRLQRHGRTAGVRLRAASVRGLKHTLGTLMAEKIPVAGGVKAIQLQMGHESVKSSLAYYDLTPEEAARRALAALS